MCTCTRPACPSLALSNTLTFVRIASHDGYIESALLLHPYTPCFHSKRRLVGSGAGAFWAPPQTLGFCTVHGFISKTSKCVYCFPCRWDGSQLYGSDAATSFRLREGVSGRMKLTPEGLLPLSTRGFGEAGVNDNCAWPCTQGLLFLNIIQKYDYIILYYIILYYII
jgi:hypothetical protein